ncbi:MAG: tetratricopeptide repeat protein [Gammaproteobacteria bacterium]
MSDTAAEPSSRRRGLFTAVAVALPFVLLAAIEGMLHLAGVAEPEPLFVPAQEPGWLEPNEAVVQRFFADPRAAPAVSIDTHYFRAEKPKDGFRLFVMGGSTAAGFPYGKWASLAGMLERRLRREYPWRTVEVIPVAMSAINSWALADFTPEILAHQPDAVIIYAGHNEYLGILGVGSAFGGGSPGLTRLTLALREFRLLALANRAWASLAGEDDSPRDGTLMARVAAEQRIPLESSLYRAGLEQFRENLGRILGPMAENGVPVFIGTLASNEKDQPPFMTIPPDDRPAEDWSRAVEEAGGLLKAGHLAEADSAAVDLMETAPLAPDGFWLRGQVLLASGRPDAARPLLLDAKDRDGLRFRAPESFNALIRQLAGRHGATLVESQRLLAERADDGIIGNELMVEHLHPNHEGYFLLSQAFRLALARAGLPWSDGEPMDEETARAAAPLTEIERLAGEYRVARLKTDWPFHDTRQPLELPPADSEPERIARAWFEGELEWAEAMNRGLRYYQQAGDFEEAARIAVNLATAFPFRPGAQAVAGGLLMRAEAPGRALPLLRQAASMEPQNTRTLMSLAQAYYMDGQPEASLQVLRRVLAVEPGHPTAPRFIEKLEAEQAGGR